MANSILMRMKSPAAALILLSIFFFGQAAAEANVRVAASIKPVHSIVSAVMEGAGEPHLLMRGAGSHHDFSLRPSDASVLEKADVIFLIDKRMELTLVKPVEILARGARVVELSNAESLVRRPWREGGAFEHDMDHHHGVHGHHDHGEENADGSFDLHVWSDPVNAAAMAHMIAETLAAIDPANAALYQGNAQDLLGRLEDLAEDVASQVKSVGDKPYIVFHDSYRYFEDRFGLAPVGSAVVGKERSPGVKRIRELRKKIRDLGVVCVFSEPHFDQGLIATIIEGTDIGSGTLDPLGVDVEDGPELYFTMMRNLAASFVDCLSIADGR
ncbi:MAG: zinc ABC transporter substrate-binding protein [Albidovulum sp.]|nr:zinc ABC transporter substrate-binding protein [Albidovulum sp.]MDE0530918.1 zinc ABC transporter substrate-binding protein [Albidovulum sp.]